jgi:hypothetical protein
MKTEPISALELSQMLLLSGESTSGKEEVFKGMARWYNALADMKEYELKQKQTTTALKEAKIKKPKKSTAELWEFPTREESDLI